MAVVRYNWGVADMEVAAEGAYVTFVAYDANDALKVAAEADVATAIVNLTYAKDMLTNYLSVSPGSLNGASVKLLAYVTAAIAALES